MELDVSMTVRSQGSSVNIVIRLRAGRSRGRNLFSSPCSDWRWGPPSLPSKSGRGVKLTTYLHLVPRLRMRGAIQPLPQYVLMGWCLVKKHRDNL